MEISEPKELSKSKNSDSSDRSFLESALKLKDNIFAGIKIMYSGIFYSEQTTNVPDLNVNEMDILSEVPTSAYSPSSSLSQGSEENVAISENGTINANSNDSQCKPSISKECRFPNTDGSHDLQTTFKSEILEDSNIFKGLALAPIVFCSENINTIFEEETTPANDGTFLSSSTLEHIPEYCNQNEVDCFSDCSNQFYATIQTAEVPEINRGKMDDISALPKTTIPSSWEPSKRLGENLLYSDNGIKNKNPNDIPWTTSTSIDCYLQLIPGNERKFSITDDRHDPQTTVMREMLDVSNIQEEPVSLYSACCSENIGNFYEEESTSTNNDIFLLTRKFEQKSEFRDQCEVDCFSDCSNQTYRPAVSNIDSTHSGIFYNTQTSELPEINKEGMDGVLSVVPKSPYLPPENLSKIYGGVLPFTENNIINENLHDNQCKEATNNDFSLQLIHQNERRFLITNNGNDPPTALVQERLEVVDIPEELHAPTTSICYSPENLSNNNEKIISKNDDTFLSTSKLEQNLECYEQTEEDCFSDYLNKSSKTEVSDLDSIHSEIFYNTQPSEVPETSKDEINKIAAAVSTSVSPISSTISQSSEESLLSLENGNTSESPNDSYWKTSISNDIPLQLINANECKFSISDSHRYLQTTLARKLLEMSNTSKEMNVSSASVSSSENINNIYEERVISSNNDAFLSTTRFEQNPEYCNKKKVDGISNFSYQFPAISYVDSMSREIFRDTQTSNQSTVNTEEMDAIPHSISKSTYSITEIPSHNARGSLPFSENDILNENRNDNQWKASTSNDFSLQLIHGNKLRFSVTDRGQDPLITLEREMLEVSNIPVVSHVSTSVCCTESIDNNYEDEISSENDDIVSSPSRFGLGTGFCGQKEEYCFSDSKNNSHNIALSKFDSMHGGIFNNTQTTKVPENIRSEIKADPSAVPISSHSLSWKPSQSFEKILIQKNGIKKEHLNKSRWKTSSANDFSLHLISNNEQKVSMNDVVHDKNNMPKEDFQVSISSAYFSENIGNVYKEEITHRNDKTVLSPSRFVQISECRDQKEDDCVSDTISNQCYKSVAFDFDTVDSDIDNISLFPRVTNNEDNRLVGECEQISFSMSNFHNQMDTLCNDGNAVRELSLNPPQFTSHCMFNIASESFPKSNTPTLVDNIPHFKITNEMSSESEKYYKNRSLNTQVDECNSQSLDDKTLQKGLEISGDHQVHNVKDLAISEDTIELKCSKNQFSPKMFGILDRVNLSKLNNYYTTSQSNLFLLNACEKADSIHDTTYAQSESVSKAIEVALETINRDKHPLNNINATLAKLPRLPVKRSTPKSFSLSHDECYRNKRIRKLDTENPNHIHGLFSTFPESNDRNNNNDPKHHSSYEVPEVSIPFPPHLCDTRKLRNGKEYNGQYLKVPSKLSSHGRRVRENGVFQKSLHEDQHFTKQTSASLKRSLNIKEFKMIEFDSDNKEEDHLSKIMCPSIGVEEPNFKQSGSRSSFWNHIPMDFDDRNNEPQNTEDDVLIIRAPSERDLNHNINGSANPTSVLDTNTSSKRVDSMEICYGEISKKRKPTSPPIRLVKSCKSRKEILRKEVKKSETPVNTPLILRRPTRLNRIGVTVESLKTPTKNECKRRKKETEGQDKSLEKIRCQDNFNCESLSEDSKNVNTDGSSFRGKLELNNSNSCITASFLTTNPKVHSVYSDHSVEICGDGPKNFVPFIESPESLSFSVPLLLEDQRVKTCAQNVTSDIIESPLKPNNTECGDNPKQPVPILDIESFKYSFSETNFEISEDARIEDIEPLKKSDS